MALETLKDVTEIGGEKVIHMDDLRETMPDLFNPGGGMDYHKFEKEIRPKFPIQIRHDKNSVSFTIQNGPIKEVGKNGCQVDHLILVAKRIIEKFNEKFPCRENSMAITKLDEAIHWLEARTSRRTKQGIEGTNKEVKND